MWPSHWSCKAITILTIGAAVAAQGCAGAREEFSVYPIDPRMPRPLIQQFFKDNPPEEVQVEVCYWPDTRDPTKEYIPVTRQWESQVIQALRTDCVPSRDPQPWLAPMPAFFLDLHGPHYSLHITLNGRGFAVGNKQQYVFTSASLAHVLAEACEYSSLLNSEHGARVRLYLKIGAGTAPSLSVRRYPSL